MAITTFFGEDDNGDPSTPLLVHPLSDAAYNAWVASLAAGPFTQNFDAFPAGNPLTGVLPPGAGMPLALTFPGSAVTATLDATGSIGGFATAVYGFSPGTTDNFGRYPVTYPNCVIDYAGTFPAQWMNIVFSQGISSFGFYGTDIGDFGGQLILQLTDTGGNVSTVTVPNEIGGGSFSPQDGNCLFFGFNDTSKKYTKIQFNNTQAGIDVFAFDNFSIGSPKNPAPNLKISLRGVKRFTQGNGKEELCEAPKQPKIERVI